MAKKNKQKSRSPNIAPAALLRPKLDAAWQAPAWLHEDEAAQMQLLDDLVRGIRPAQYLPVMTKAWQALDPAACDESAPLIAAWLTQRGDIAYLRDQVTAGRLDAADSATARQWLEYAGEAADVRPQSATERFFTALEGVDEFGSQGILCIAWYPNRQHSRVRGCYFLVDFNPPWDGAVKDIIWLTWRDPERGRSQFIEEWSGRLATLTELDAVAAKGTMVERLLANRAAGISLHRDIVAGRDEILAHILTLPDGPDTPSFSADDFDSLTALPQRSEEVSHFERTVARRVRMKDGKELYVSADLADPDDDWL